MKFTAIALLLGAVLVHGQEEGEAAATEDESPTYEIPYTTLHGGQKFPLVGYGVGNLQHDLVESHVADAMDMHYRMFDTAHASLNEAEIQKGLDEGLHSDEGIATHARDLDLHVVTKVWYTYLGYERTKISVKESLEALKASKPNVKVHMLLHWPRCNDDIPWMNCEQEEEALPQAVKDAGPAPHLDKQNAYKESWRALEDIYLGKVSLGDDLPELESIGVSNFQLDDLKELAATARVTPHMVQDNVWSFLYDPYLMKYLDENKIHLQVYNTMNGILGGHEDAPHAWDSLDAVSAVLTEDVEDGDIHASQLVLKWLIQHDVSVIPRTMSREHMADNAPPTVAKLPELEDNEIRVIEEAVGALLRRQDLVKPKLSFVNKMNDVLHLFWFDHDEEEEVPVKMELAPGETWNTDAFEGHTFIAYDSKEVRREFVVTAGFGEEEEINIEPEL